MSVGMEEEKGIVEFGKKESQNVNKIIKKQKQQKQKKSKIKFLSFHLLRFVVFYWKINFFFETRMFPAFRLRIKIITIIIIIVI